jgi:hypothetical protein
VSETKELFAPDSAPPVRPRPERDCSQEQCAKEMLGLPKDWRATTWQVVGDVKSPIGIQLSGGVYRHVKTRGPNKGKTDFRKPEPGSEVTLVVGKAQFEAWRAKWEAETGWCSECHGTGVVFAGWNHITGTRMRVCKPCGGTGDKPQEQAA